MAAAEKVRVYADTKDDAYVAQARAHRLDPKNNPEPEYTEERVVEVSGTIDGKKVTRNVRESQVEEYEAVFEEARAAKEESR